MFDYKLELVSASKRSVVVVVAPLVALMVDQDQSLRAKGVACFDRGLCRAVSGDTPNSPLVSLVLFKFLLSSGDSPMLPCWTKEHLAKVLNL